MEQEPKGHLLGGVVGEGLVYLLGIQGYAFSLEYCGRGVQMFESPDGEGKGRCQNCFVKCAQTIAVSIH